MQNRLTEQIRADMKLVQQMLKEQPSLLRKMKSSLDLPESKPAQMLGALRDRIADDFPELPEIEFETRYVHKSMENYLSPAFYLTPPLDTGSPNIIYINPADFPDTFIKLFTSRRLLPLTSVLCSPLPVT